MASSSAKARQRADLPEDVWHYSGTEHVHVGEDDWRVIAYRGNHGDHQDVTPYVTAVTWEDNGPILTGTVSIRKPADMAHLDLGDGHVLRLDHRRLGQGAFNEVWRMRIGGPVDNTVATINPKEGTYDFQLADDLALLAKSGKVHYKVRKDKAHPKGVLVHDAIRTFCAREGIPVTALPVMRHRIKKWSMHAEPLNIIAALVRQENHNEDSDYRLAWRNGGLTLLPKQRSKYLLYMSDSIVEAALTQGRRADYANLLEVKATASKDSGKDSKDKPRRKRGKIAVTVQSARHIARFGRIKRKVTVEADSQAEALRKGRQALVKRLRPKRTLSITHAGIPGLRRQHALKIKLPDQGIEQIVYVTAVSHSVSAGEYTMEVTVRFTDPFVDKKKEKREQEKRDKARQRNRSTTANTGGTQAPKAKNARQRSDKAA